jgi:transcriptional regulator with XRE-family HTH domain
MTLGELIKLSRLKNNMTQPELADLAQIEQSYLSKLENDKCSPSFEVIQKVAAALNQDAMTLINKLSAKYISKNLAHLPEVAAEFSAIKKQQLLRLKRRFILASMVVVIGMGMFMVGQMSLLFPERFYTYKSDGVIKEGEPLMQFSQKNMSELGEGSNELKTRLQNNAKRFDRKFLQFSKKQANIIIETVDGGKRYYELYDSDSISDIRNEIVSIFGMMIMLSGFFGFWYVFKFKE